MRRLLSIYDWLDNTINETASHMAHQQGVPLQQHTSLCNVKWMGTRLLIMSSSEGKMNTTWVAIHFTSKLWDLAMEHLHICKRRNLIKFHLCVLCLLHLNTPIWTFIDVKCAVPAIKIQLNIGKIQESIGNKMIFISITF